MQYFALWAAMFDNRELLKAPHVREVKPRRPGSSGLERKRQVRPSVFESRSLKALCKLENNSSNMSNME